MIQVPIAIIQLSDVDDVYKINTLTEQWGEQCTYTIVYQTPIDDGLERVWCQEHFVGGVWPTLHETVQSRIVLSAPVALTLIVISAVLIDLDDTNHIDNVNQWDANSELPDDDDYLDLPSDLDNII